MLNNDIKVLAIGVAYTPRTSVSGGMPWMSGGIGRWSNGLRWDLSGKPTFLSVLLNEGWAAAYDPQQPFNTKLISHELHS